MSDGVKKHRALKKYMDNRSQPPNTPSLLIDNDHDHNNLSIETIVNSVVNKENNYGAFVSDNESSFSDCVDDSNQSIYPAESEVIISNETDTDNSDSNNKNLASGTSQVASATSQVLNDYLNDTDSVSSSLFENSNFSRAALSNKSEKLKNGSKRLPEINADMTYDGACSNCGLSKYILNEYIELKFTEMSKKLDKMKFSLLYEIQKQGGNIKTQVIMNSASSKAPNKTLSEAREIYKEIFPFDNLENFKKFDDKLDNENEKSDLKNLFEVLTYGEKDVNTCIRKTLSEVITPEVQQFYSGAGRMIRGEGKLNFSATKTYVCLSDIIQKKFGDSDQTKNLRSSVRSFLANFGDSDGSKRKRA
ncbi:hypothetical protein KQX54_014795 [Cotesia glomerata]|uniref:DUF4806 domain-containing protein n=1 Tax=Cotesia glomerata TaxID=32391 RepID=A0AAV7I2Z6_COTGL|nr:hypothetical protein KQX54_014795 [Cotesia glomerata]